MTKKVPDQKLSQFMRFHHDINQRVLSGSLDPDEVMDAVRPLIGMKKPGKRFGHNLLDPNRTFTVPSDYDHDTQVDRFGKKTKGLESKYYYNDSVSGGNFANATNRLEPGKSYAVKVFPILEQVTSKDCLDFLKSNNAILVGAQGVMLLQEHQPDVFPKGKYTVSFDEKDALWKDADGRHRVPLVYRFSDGDWKFRLGYFEFAWFSGHVLVCFCDLDQPSDA